MEIRPEIDLRPRVQAALERNIARLTQLLPEAEVEHIGATAVPGALTKGDVDLLVRVAPERFGDAVRILGSNLAPHHPEDWTPTLASFKEQPEIELPVGVQLVIADSNDDRVFVRWRELLRADDGLLASYNEFKSAHADEDYEGYTEAKGAFIEQVLRRR